MKHAEDEETSISSRARFNSHEIRVVSQLTFTFHSLRIGGCHSKRLSWPQLLAGIFFASDESLVHEDSLSCSHSDEFQLLKGCDQHFWKVPVLGWRPAFRKIYPRDVAPRREHTAMILQRRKTLTHRCAGFRALRCVFRTTTKTTSRWRLGIRRLESFRSVLSGIYDVCAKPGHSGDREQRIRYSKETKE